MKYDGNLGKKKKKYIQKRRKKYNLCLQVVMEVHPLLGQLDCLLAGEEAKRGKKKLVVCFCIFMFLNGCFLHFLHF